VLVFQNGGGIRTNLAAGVITEEDCYAMLPFDTRLTLCKIAGKQVIRLIREGLTNRKGLLQSYGLRLHLKEPADDRTKFDSVTFVYRGKTIPIEPETKYWVVLDSFIVGGGDYYSTDIFDGGIVSENGMYPREILSRYIREDLNGHVVINDDDCVQVK
jgi:2',3'-cyclic-nucleotide 2'-phosphodiesterase (5'-nucleotidase family)